MSNDTLSENDKIASEACTRSGLFALAMSIVLFVLMASWAQKPSEIALARYLGYRYNLILNLERLDDDPVWKKFENSNPLVETTSISKLPNTVPDGGPPQPSIASNSPPRQDETTKRPAAPKLLSVTTTEEIPEAGKILDVIKDLNDSDLLTKSRDYSNFFNFSISRWAQKRESLIYQNAVSDGCATEEIERPFADKHPASFVPTISQKVLLACLKLRDVRELAKFEQPVMVNPDQIGGHVGRDTDATPGSLPKEPFTATLVSQAFLFFVVIYFGAYTRVATLSEQFPLTGTLFGAFAGSRVTLTVLLLAVFTPCIASFAVAVESRSLWLWPISILILGAALFVFITLNEGSYWKRLIPTDYIVRRKQHRSA